MMGRMISDRKARRHLDLLMPSRLGSNYERRCNRVSSTTENASTASPNLPRPFLETGMMSEPEKGQSASTNGR